MRLEGQFTILPPAGNKPPSSGKNCWRVRVVSLLTASGQVMMAAVRLASAKVAAAGSLTCCSSGVARVISSTPLRSK